MRQTLDQSLTTFRTAKSQAADERKSLKSARRELKDTVAAHAHLQELVRQLQSTCHEQVARVVSSCLTAVFGKPYELRIEFVKRRGKTEAEFSYLDKDGRSDNPRVSSGGVLEVAGVALRLVAMTLALPPLRRLLILDEPFSGLSKDNLPKIGMMLERLSRDLDCQFIIATHSDALKIGKVVEL